MSSSLGPIVPDWRAATAPPRVVMRGNYCVLRPLASDDAALWPLIENQPEVFDYLPYGPFDSPDAWATWLHRELRRDDAVSFAICDFEGAIRGYCSYLRMDLNNGSIEIGNVLFAPVLQRTRAATEAMFLLMRAAFQNGFRRYEWKCNSLNLPSARAARRLGFTFEGTFRQAAVVKGRNRDTDWFSVLDGEWPALKNAFERWLAPDNFNETGAQRERLERLRAD